MITGRRRKCDTPDLRLGRGVHDTMMGHYRVQHEASGDVTSDWGALEIV